MSSPAPSAGHPASAPGARAAFQRAELLLGTATLEALAGTRVIIFGLGGVGSWAAEGLVRSGLGHLTLVDSDHICVTNINRQSQATSGSVGQCKAEALAARLRDINPQAAVVARLALYNLASRDSFALEGYDYIIDAIDSLSPKLGLIMQALTLTGQAGRAPRLCSSMGASAKLDPTRVRVASIWKTRGDPLARRIRKRLFRHGVTADFACVYSDEFVANRLPATACGTAACCCPRRVPGPDGPVEPHEWCSSKRALNGSLVQVTATFGLCLCGLVVNDVAARRGGCPPVWPELGAATASRRTIDIAVHADDADIDSGEDEG